MESVNQELFLSQQKGGHTFLNQNIPHYITNNIYIPILLSDWLAKALSRD